SPGTFNGTYGDLQLQADGSYTYTLNTAGVQHLADGVSITDSFSYQTTDGSASSNSANLVVTILGQNDAPVAAADSATMTEDDASVSGNVLDNDSDVDDGASLSVASPGTFNGTYGDLQLQADGSYTYTLNTAGVQHLADGASVTDSFSYQTSDGSASSNSANLVVTILGQNDAPVAAADSATLTEDDNSVSGNVLDNDSDVDDGASLSVASPGTFNGTYGDLQLQADGSYTYTLNTAGVQHLADGASITDSFSYQTTDGSASSNSANLVVTILGQNDAPVAAADSASLTEDDNSVSGNVLDNDSDVDDGASLSVASPGTFNGTYGTLDLASDGSYTYTLNTAGVQHLADGASVTDSFSYQTTDGSASSNSANLVVTILGQNDAPVAAADSATLTEDDASVSGNVLDNDSDVDDGASLSVASPGTFNGTYGTLDLASDGSY